MADELERLTASLDADITKFSRKLDQALQKFDSNAGAIERRNASMVSRINNQFGALSLGKIAGAVGAAGLFEKLVEGSKELADQTLNTSKALGYSAETLQGLGIIARKAGVDHDALTTSLEHFSAQVGQAQLKQTDFGKAMAKLGVDLKGGPEKALLSLSDKFAQLPKAQQAAVAQLALGRGGVANLAWLSQGSASIKALIANFQRLGQIVPTDKLEKVQQIFDAWQDIKTTALTGFMDGFSEFAGQVGSGSFQAGVETFGKVMGEVSGFVVQMAPHIPLILEMLAAFNAAKGGAMIGGAIGEIVGGPPGGAAGIALGGLAGGAAGYYGTKKLLSAGGAGAPAAPGAAPAPTGSIDLSGALDDDKVNRTLARLADLRRQLDQEVADYQQKANASYAGMVKAANDATGEMLKGSAAYYDFEKKAINDTADLDIKRTLDEQDIAIQALQDRRNSQVASLKTLNLDAQTFAAQKKLIDQATGQAEGKAAQDTANKIEEINQKKNQALLQNDYQFQQQQQNLLEVTQNLRDGLTSVALAGVSGFKSMKQAAADLVLQMAQMVIKIKILQPLLDSLLGPSGTFGGGIFGDLIGSVFGGGSLATNAAASIVANPFLFADGGVFVPGQGRRPLKTFAGGGVSNQAAIFGEDGIEAAVPLPDGKSIPVTLRMPQVARAQAPIQNVIQNYDMSGALVTQDVFAEIDRRAKVQAVGAIAQFNRNMLPGRVQQLSNDPRRRH